MKNLDIREAAKVAGINLWEIAEKLKLNDSNFSRRLRKELSEEEKGQIFKIIKELEDGENDT